MIVGLVGTVLPTCSGLPLVYAGMLLAAWADGFQRIGARRCWCCSGLLTLLSLGIDLAGDRARAPKRVGANRAGGGRER